MYNCTVLCSIFQGKKTSKTKRIKNIKVDVEQNEKKNRIVKRDEKENKKRRKNFFRFFKTLHACHTVINSLISLKSSQHVCPLQQLSRGKTELIYSAPIFAKKCPTCGANCREKR